MLRFASMQDADMVRRWLRHPAVIGLRVGREGFSDGQFARWWSKLLVTASCHVMVFEWKGVPSGVVVYDLDRPWGGAVWWCVLDVEGIGVEELASAWHAVMAEGTRRAFHDLRLSGLYAVTGAANVDLVEAHRRVGGLVSQVFELSEGGVAVPVVWLVFEREAWLERRR